MRKIIVPFLCLALMANCGVEAPSVGGGGGQSNNTPLVVGDTDQSGVNYRSSSVIVNFEQTLVDGDSTFYEVSIDLDEASSSDITFTLVKWGEFQVVTVQGTNGMRIPFAGSDVEIIEIEHFLPGAKFLLTGTAVNVNTATNYNSEIDGLATYTYEGEISILSEQSLWNDKVYLPFVSALVEGWIGINIEVSSGVEISGIGINTIAYREL